MDGYGSLDRSWARRARGSTGGIAGIAGLGGIGHKKRPDLMSADFSGSALATSPLATENVNGSSTANTNGVLEPLPETSAVESENIQPGMTSH